MDSAVTSKREEEMAMGIEQTRQMVARLVGAMVNGNGGVPVEMVLAGLVDDLRALGVVGDRETGEILESATRWAAESAHSER
ncbi:MAG: hypothetical protein Q8R91_03825 [Candidatus Omnitrophota bacterium]|nr:hypothetical protein [Candidatus Omnitrophota bacterium]